VLPTVTNTKEFQNKEFELLQRHAELIVDNDPELKSLRVKFYRFGCTPSQALAAVLGRVWESFSASNGVAGAEK
jgi:hypothetical protein